MTLATDIDGLVVQFLVGFVGFFWEVKGDIKKIHFFQVSINSYF